MKRKIYINLKGEKEKKNDKRENKDTERSAGYRMAFSYQGLAKMGEYQRIMRSLIEGTEFILKNVKPPNSKIPAYEIRDMLKEKYPQVKIVFKQPPDGIYHTANPESYRTLIQKVWPNIREFAREFLDCESYSRLLSDSMSCFLLMPEILSKTYVYLTTASESFFVSIAANLSNRSNMLVITLLRSIYSELMMRVQMVGQKRRIRKEVDKKAKYFRFAKSKA
jgi:hypothetical protein